uniref:(California timema) hypothetical protein n=1 Tax=Timema californicum TaxID=61474 RepID=A0A7R9PA43_TIMCA|nr:unnamed protein product [Timema californicum]
MEYKGPNTGYIGLRMNNHRFDTNRNGPDKPVLIHSDLVRLRRSAILNTNVTHLNSYGLGHFRISNWPILFLFRPFKPDGGEVTTFYVNRSIIHLALRLSGPSALSTTSLKPILWDGGREGERRGVASQLIKISFHANKNRWNTETVDGASYRPGLAHLPPTHKSHKHTLSGIQTSTQGSPAHAQDSQSHTGSQPDTV